MDDKNNKTIPTKIKELLTGTKASPNGDSSSGLFLENLIISSDPTYAYSPDNPVKVANDENPLGYSIPFLKSLRGPNGEIIEFYRKSSFNHHSDDPDKHSLTLDRYVLEYNGVPGKIIIYLNIYEKSNIMVPMGLTPRR